MVVDGNFCSGVGFKGRRCRSGDLMNKNVSFLCLSYQVFIISRVMTVDKDMTTIFDPKRIGGANEFSMIDFNGNYLQPITIEHNSLRIEVGNNSHVLRINFMISNPNVTIWAGYQPRSFGNIVHSWRPIDM